MWRKIRKKKLYSIDYGKKNSVSESHGEQTPPVCMAAPPSVTLVTAGCFSHSGGSYIGHVRYYNKLPRARWFSSNSLITGLEAAGSVSAGSSLLCRTKARAVSLYWDTDFIRDWQLLLLWHHEVLTTYHCRHLRRPSCHPGGAKNSALTLECRGTYTAHAHAVPLLICIWESLYFILTASQGWQRPFISLSS